jgi:hypothetical protein
MLAYVFWHRPKEDVDREAYEAAQRDFHHTLDVTSACFRLTRLPFSESAGYEDWYLAGDWAGLGRLNEAAVGPARRPCHDRAADLASSGWGAVYRLQRGAAEIPAGIEWRDKPRGEPAAAFLDRLGATAAWRRELVLGPAPEFCLATRLGSEREQVWLP